MAGNIPEASDAPNVEERPLGTPYDESHASPETFGSGTADDVTDAGAKAQRLAVETTTRFNFAAAEGAYGRAQQAYNDIIANPQHGLLSLKGADAVNKSDELTKKFKDTVNSIRAQLTPAQERDIGYRFDQHILEPGLLQAATHERHEHGVVADAELKGSELATIDKIQTLAGNPGTTVGELDEATRALVENAHSRAAYKYGANPSADAVKLEALPLMHKAAIDAMSAAIATNDPQHATNVLGVFQEHLGPAAKMYNAAVGKMLSQHQIATVGEQILGAATVPVYLPDGTQTSKLDEGKVNAGLTRIASEPPVAKRGTTVQTQADIDKDQAAVDDWAKNVKPHQAEILKYVEQQQQRLDTAWKKTVAQQLDVAKQQGDPLKTGDFDMSHVDFKTRAWLAEHDESGLIALNALQNKEDARERQAARFEKRQELYDARDASERTQNVVSAQIVEKDNLDILLKQSPEEFQSRLLKGQDMMGDPLPEPLVGKHLSELVKTYRQAQKDAGDHTLGEKPETFVHAAIQKAADGDVDVSKELEASLFKTLNDLAHKKVKSTKGIKPEELTAYIEKELGQGIIKGSGWFKSDFMAESVRRAEYETLPKYKGKQFVPAESATPGVEVEHEAPPTRAAATSAQGAAPATQQAPAAPAGPAAPPGRVWVYDKNGRKFDLRENQLEEALKQGYQSTRPTPP